MSRQINLFDDSLRPRKPVLNAASMLLCFAAAAGALSAYQQFASRQVAALEAQRVQAEAQRKDLQARLTRIGGPKAPDKSLQDEIARTETQVRNWQQLLDRLHGTGIGNTEGHAKLLEGLARQHTEGVWLTEIKVGDAGAGFSLKGRASRPELVASYIQLLNREASLRGRAIAQLELSEKTEADPTYKDKGKAAAEPAGKEVRFVQFSIASTARAAEQTARAELRDPAVVR